VDHLTPSDSPPPPAVPAPAPVGRLLAWSAAVAAAAFVLAALTAWQYHDVWRRMPVFTHLFVRYDTTGAVAGLLVLLAAALVPWPAALPGRVVAALAARPPALAVFATAACAAGALLAYLAHPLCMDEYSPVFQAQVFASGRVRAQYPPGWIEWLFPKATRMMFVMTSPVTGQAVSWYWPGFALLLTPFTALGVPWLLNPVISGVAVWLLADTARRLTGDPLAGGWAALLALASPAFMVNGMSYYSMPAHMTANLLFGWLLLTPTPARLVLAGVTGSLALVLHNPVPHAAFALPWLVWLAAGPGRLARLGRLAAGYLPLTLAVGLGWLAVKGAVIGPGAANAAQGVGERGLWATLLLSFTLPGSEVLGARIVGLAKLVVWAVPVLPVLAVFGAAAGRDIPGVRLWTASAIMTLLAYLPVRFDQGHGWGYRYFHSAWAAMPLLASVALVRFGRLPGGTDLARVTFTACVLGAGVLVPLRAAQTGEFIREHLAQLPPVSATAPGWPVVFLHTDWQETYYASDLVQNRWDLSRPPWVFDTHGPEADAAFVRKLDPDAAREWTDGRSSVWRIDPGRARLPSPRSEAVP
jgi:hypothetical protein